MLMMDNQARPSILHVAGLGGSCMSSQYYVGMFSLPQPHVLDIGLKAWKILQHSVHVLRIRGPSDVRWLARLTCPSEERAMRADLGQKSGPPRILIKRLYNPMLFILAYDTWNFADRVSYHAVGMFAPLPNTQMPEQCKTQ